MRAVPWAFGVVLLFAGCGDPSPQGGAAAVSGDAARPAEASAAVVVALAGTVAVRSASGAEIPATPQLHLSRGDTVVTAPGAYAVLVLHNGHVVRLDEDLQSPIAGLAWIDAPPPEKGLEELFADALSPDEIARAGGSQALLRIAGWNARRAAGESPAALPARDAPAEAQDAPAAADGDGAPTIEALKAPTRDSERAPPGAPPRPVEADDPAPANRPADALHDRPVEAKAAKKKRADRRPDAPTTQDDALMDPFGGQVEPGIGDGVGGSGGVAGKTSPAQPEESTTLPGGGGSADLADQWSLRTGSGAQVRKDSLPPALAARRGEIARCVADGAKGIAQPELLLRVEGGVVVNVTLGGGAPAPACARALKGLELPEVTETGWVAVRVRR